MKKRNLVFRLASADLLHERSMTLCLMLAITAVVCPLLVLFGLKFGVIQTLRDRLLQDPANRELFCTSTEGFDTAWLAALGQREDIDVVIPFPRTITSGAHARKAGIPDAAFEALDLIPTASGDPLLLGNGVSGIPSGRQAVLTSSVGQRLQAITGDQIEVRVTRTRAGKFEEATLSFEVTGILDIRADPRDALYCELEFVENVGKFREGAAVPQYGGQWSEGGKRAAYEVYDGLFLCLEKPLTTADGIQVRKGTGFRSLDASTADEFTEKTGLPAPEAPFFYFMDVSDTRPGIDRIVRVRRRLIGNAGFLVPVSQAMSATLTTENGTSTAVILRPLGFQEVGKASFAGPKAPPWPGETEGRVALLSGTLASASKSGVVSLALGGERLEFPLDDLTVEAPADSPVKTRPESILFIPHRLAARLSLSRDRKIEFDAVQSDFLLSRESYQGFRAYARSIDDVEEIRSSLQGGLNARGLLRTAAKAIGQVQKFDNALSVLFLVIASAGVFGATSSLASNYIAAVERKTKELSVLRLIGFSGMRLLRFPLYQAAIVAVGGVLGAFALYFGLASLINDLASDLLQSGERACRLATRHVIIAFAGTLFVACSASLIAGRRAARVDPSAGLRDE